MPERRAGTAATPAPDDTLREQIQTLLARTADEIDMEFDHQEHPEGTCPICDALFVAGHQVRDLADALLPLIRECIAAAEQAERERAAIAVEELPGPNGEGVAKWPKQHADVYMLAIEEAAGHIRALDRTEATDGTR